MVAICSNRFVYSYMFIILYDVVRFGYLELVIQQQGDKDVRI
jgi:hypothetical protein